jgi:hypothetical protein
MEKIDHSPDFKNLNPVHVNTPLEKKIKTVLGIILAVALLASLIAMITFSLGNPKLAEGTELCFFEKIVFFLLAGMERPGLYGTWHICSLIITAAVTVFLSIRYKNADNKRLRKVLFVVWIIMVLFEIYKQVVFSMDSDGMTATWAYQWYAFPFQFCSTPLYLLPILIFVPEGRFRNAVMAYMATFSLCAGLAVMFYPSTVFVDIIGINIQTMVHHGFQVAIGIMLVVHNRHHLNKRFFAWCMMVFTALALIANTLNIVMYNVFQHLGMDQTFNMFFVSPYYPGDLPILCDIHGKVPYPIYLLIYIVGFTLISMIVYTIEKMIVKIAIKEKFIRDKHND